MSNLGHVCHITSVHTRYDIRIFIKECCSLVKAGYQVSLIVADGLGDEIKCGVSIYDVGTQNNKHSRLRRILFIPRKIYQKVLLLKPDIVQFHDPELMLIGLWLQRLNYKVIYDVHENLPKQILSKYWIKKPLRKLIAVMLDKLECFVVKRIAGVVTVIDAIGRRFETLNHNVIIVHNYPYLSNMSDIKADTLSPINHNKDNSVNSNWQHRPGQLVYIGGISEIRGIKQLINSLVISGLSLELAGNLSGITAAQLQQIDGYRYVKYYGSLPHIEAMQLLEHTKIGILTLLPVPSYIESLPIKLFEYMLAGLPVIASNFKDWESIILKYNCGIMVDPCDAAAIAQASAALINDPVKAMQMGQNGRAAVLQHFNWEHESQKLIDLYLVLLKK